MQITFSRSGGFAGPATAIDGTVTVQGDTAHVTAASGYRRDLTPDEIQSLRSAAAQPAPARAASPGPMRDAYQYDIRITRDDGSTQSMTQYR